MLKHPDDMVGGHHQYSQNDPKMREQLKDTIQYRVKAAYTKLLKSHTRLHGPIMTLDYSYPLNEVY